jgi:hypothetical protein
MVLPCSVLLCVYPSEAITSVTENWFKRNITPVSKCLRNTLIPAVSYCCPTAQYVPLPWYLRSVLRDFEGCNFEDSRFFLLRDTDVSPGRSDLSSTTKRPKNKVQARACKTRGRCKKSVHVLSRETLSARYLGNVRLNGILTEAAYQTVYATWRESNNQVLTSALLVCLIRQIFIPSLFNYNTWNRHVFCDELIART